MNKKGSIDDPNYTNQQTTTVGGKVIRAIATIGGIVLASIIFFNIITSSRYYVAKFPGYNAATVMVDGYLHKSKSCCQKVADAFGATVVSVGAKAKAGTNSYGQTVTYDAAFLYCPLCCY